MPCFNNIVASIGLAPARDLEAAALIPLMKETVHHAIWLARLNKARLLFLLEKEERTHDRPTAEVLADLVRQAEAEGVQSQAQLVLGKPWLEIVRRVLRDRHDLVVVATEEASGLRRRLFGDTAVKLLRHCPCPVWVNRPGHGGRALSTVIATDMRPASTSALRLGMKLGELMGGPVHVLHVLEYPLDYLWSRATPDWETAAYHVKVLAEAEAGVQRQLDEVSCPFPPDFHVHLKEGTGVPDQAIQHFVQAHNIDLLMMGTIGRGGMAGLMLGNLVERLLPEVPCSVLAVKPPDFKCPVRLEGDE